MGQVSKRLDETARVRGIVEFFNAEKGFGVIRSDGSAREIFVGVGELIDAIKAGDHVEFKLLNGKQVLTAVEVRRI